MSISILNRGASGGLKPELTVVAPSGSTIDLLQNSIIIDTYTLGASETEHTFIVKVGTYTVRGTLGGETKDVETVIDVVGRYEVFVPIKLYLYNRGDLCEEVTGGYGMAWLSNSHTSGTGSFAADHLYSAETSQSAYGNRSFITKKLVNLKGYTKLKAIIDCTAKGGSSKSSFAEIGVHQKAWVDGEQVSGNYTFLANAQWGTTSSGSVTNHLLEADISEIDEGAIEFRGYSQSYAAHTVIAKCYEIWLE